jgi:2-dehydro-3-deoxygluconokinase
MTDMPANSRLFDVATFGETMLRLAAPNCGRLEDAVTLDVRVGGSESNTAVALARLGLKAAWWSKLPANPLGRRIENEIRRWGVSTDAVIWDEAPDCRAGLYFLDFGAPPRGTDVYYDRAASSASRITAIEMEATTVPISQARLLHLSGITPALSPYALKACTRAMQISRESGTPVSFDINYRAKLWSPQRAKEALEPLLAGVDLLICPITDAASLFNIEGSGTGVAAEFRERYDIPSVVITMGGDGAAGVDSAGNEHSAKPFPLTQIIDRVGAGDAFNAGVLMGYLNGDLREGMQYGMAMSALKHTIPGDLLISTRHEIDAARAGSSGGIKR